MDTTESPDRWREIRKLHHDEKFIYQIMGGVALLAAGILLGAAIFAQDSGYATNLYTEILSIIVTVFILNLLAERREEVREEQKLKAQLVRDAGSQSNEAALKAITELQQREWLEDESGLLKGENLAGAKLQGANLLRANLQNTNLFGANLQDTDLFQANLQGANIQFSRLPNADLRGANLQTARLFHVNLQDANLGLARLQGADLRFANLQRVVLFGANLQGVNLFNAKLQNAILEHTTFDENTILPDESKWTPGTDLTRFTDSDHPDFWSLDVSPSIIDLLAELDAALARSKRGK